MTGNVHSIETFGTLDGPGIRYVVFLRGCPLRCKFCHNPDTWAEGGGDIKTSQEIIEDILKYRSFIKSGGVTMTGGEPLMQSEFVAEVLDGCKKQGLHTAIDTSGCVPLAICQKALDAADLILLDIKHINNQKCKELTGQGNENAMQILDYLEKSKKEVWIRHVVVPGYTEDLESIKELAEYLSKFSVIKKVEILPFHKMGEYKWEELGLEYELKDTKTPSSESINQIKDIFRTYNLNV